MSRATFAEEAVSTVIKWSLKTSPDIQSIGVLHGTPSRPWVNALKRVRKALHYGTALVDPSRPQNRGAQTIYVLTNDANACRFLCLLTEVLAYCFHRFFVFTCTQ